jgi:hypothetical protein
VLRGCDSRELHDFQPARVRREQMRFAFMSAPLAARLARVGDESSHTARRTLFDSHAIAKFESRATFHMWGKERTAAQPSLAQMFPHAACRRIVCALVEARESHAECVFAFDIYADYQLFVPYSISVNIFIIRNSYNKSKPVY